MNPFRGQVFRFLLVGGVAVLIDGASYAALDHWAPWGAQWSKRLSFFLGSIWAFFANKYFTFQSAPFRTREPFLFAAIYVLGFLLNSAVHDLIFRFTGVKGLAFFTATAFSTVSNFIGQKWLVFRRDAGKTKGGPSDES